MYRISSIFVTEPERQHVTRRTRFQQHREAELSSRFFLQDKAPNEFHAILTETLGNKYNRMPPSKTGCPSLNVVVFPPYCASSWTTQSSNHPEDY